LSVSSRQKKNATDFFKIITPHILGKQFKTNYMSYNIKINYNKEVLIDETFSDAVQFKLFLKSIHGCLALKNTLMFYNGNDFLVNIPYEILAKCIIYTKTKEYTLTDHLVAKSKMESLV